MVGGIFISYRRGDARGSAGRLYDDLSDTFGEDLVFRDIEAIDPGVDYVTKIQECVRSCDAFVTVIGHGWLGAVDEAGRRRLEDPSDFVRREISAALEAGKVVIPVLVQEATMPSEEELPPPLAPLATRNALRITDERWDYDVGLLVARLRELPGLHDVTPPGEPAAVAVRPSRQGARSAGYLLLGLLVVGLVLLVVYRVAVAPDAAQRRDETNGSAAAQSAYQRRVRDLCLERAQSEARVRTRTEEIGTSFQSGSLDYAAFFGESLGLYVETNNAAVNLKSILKGLEPPPDLASTHHDTVEAWERLIGLERQFTDGYRVAGAGGFPQLAQYLQTYDLTVGRQLDDRINAGLTQLAGSGCRPAS